MTDSASANKSTIRKQSSEDLLVDEQFHPHSGTYFYDVFLGGMRIGKATITSQQRDGLYSIAVTAKTRKVLQSLYRVRYRGEVQMTTDPIRPRSAIIEEKTGSKNKKFIARFPEPDRVTSVQIENTEGQRVKHEENEFISESFILDPFSTVFLIRSLKWKVGDVEIFDVFTGKKQYELHLICRRETKIEFNEELRPVWEIVPKTFTLSHPRKEKLSHFSVYLSKDNKREILKITGDPSIGRVVARMRKFEKDERD